MGGGRRPSGSGAMMGARRPSGSGAMALERRVSGSGAMMTRGGAASMRSGTVTTTTTVTKSSAGGGAPRSGGGMMGGTYTSTSYSSRSGAAAASSSAVTAVSAAVANWRPIDLRGTHKELAATDEELLYLLDLLQKLREENHAALQDKLRMKRELEAEKGRVDKITIRMKQERQDIEAERRDADRLFGEAEEAYKRLVGSSDILVQLMNQEKRAAGIS